MDNFTENANISFFSKLKSVLIGFLFGAAFFVGSFVLLFWNEGNSIKTIRANNFVRDNVISIVADEVLPANNGKLVHIVGNAVSEENLADSLGVGVPRAIALFRKVEMYQWIEKEKTTEKDNIGGSTSKTTEYTYSKGWSDYLNDSSSFRHPQGHENPANIPFSKFNMYSNDVLVGAFMLSQEQVREISGARDDVTLPQNPKFQIFGNMYFYGQDINNAKIGDMKISYSYIPSGVTVSVIGKQENSRIVAYKAKQKHFIELQMGTKSVEEMMNQLDSQNEQVTWIIRLGGFLMMFIGLSMLFRPLTIFADIIPFFASIVGVVTGFVLFIVSLLLTIITISIAWFAYRPLLSLSLIAVAVLVIYWVIKKKNQAAPI